MTENQVLGDRVLIKPSKESKSSGGVYINESSQGRPQKGEVILVGPGTKDIEMVISIGDEVLFGEYSGVEVLLDGEKFLLMKQDDVLMKLKKY